MEEEFEDYLDDWQAEILPGQLIIRFNELYTKFATGSSQLTEEFQDIIADFFPRYLDILLASEYSEQIAEIRIDGHASSEWLGTDDEIEAYKNNLNLSQDRAYNTLEYCLSLTEVSEEFEWLKNRLISTGMSSSNPVYIDGEEDKEQSRRVEFRIITTIED
nr:OmpA family protein [Halonatronomonas betaini]